VVEKKRKINFQAHAKGDKGMCFTSLHFIDELVLVVYMPTAKGRRSRGEEGRDEGFRV
jgi:hypothetical protein